MADHKLYSNQFLNKKRTIGDPPADQFIQDIFVDASQKQLLLKFLNDAQSRHEFEILKNHFPGYLVISQARELPSWANPRLMQTGSAFFIRHSETIMSLLGLLSLPYCYAAADGAMVLYLSELIRKQTAKRLYDTATFVWKVMEPGAFSANGNAFHEILKVRLMHSAVRYYTMQSGKWNDSWGLPINQEDMAGTNLSFSLIVIRGLRALGFSISTEEQLAFMHIWAVTGYLTGLNADLIPATPKLAQQLDTEIKRRQFRTSVQGQALTRSLISHILSINNRKASKNEVLGLMRYLLGNEIADMLAVSVPELSGYKLSLMKTINLFKSFLPEWDINQRYRNSYRRFKKQNPEINKSV